MKSASNAPNPLLLSLLGDGQSDDYWFDEQKLYSQDCLRRLSTDEWQLLSSDWALLDFELQDRLAGLLGYGGTVQEAEVLLQMCWRSDRDIELTARESLRGMTVDVVKAAVDVAIQKRELPVQASNYSSVNGILDFLRAKRDMRDVF